MTDPAPVRPTPASSAEASGKGFEKEVVDEQLAHQKRERWLSWAIGLAFALVFLGGWEAIARARLIDPLFISDPVSVGKALIANLATPSIWKDAWATASTATGGLVLGAIVGIPAGIAFHAFPALRRGLSPFVVIFNSLPRPALAPIFILWFGLGAYAKLAVSFSLVFFVMLLNTLAGLAKVDPDIDQLARSLGMSGWRRFRHIDLMSALPSIIAGLRLSAVYSVLGVVVAEIVASYHGLGQRLTIDTNSMAIASAFSILFIMTVVAMVLDYGVSLLERIVQWQGANPRE
ncbi:MAG: ABC transporter permease [Burkholderiales bacterium]|jgi:NitT/TauT family transport system permease protein